MLAGGGFTETDRPMLIGQVQIVDASSAKRVSYS